MALFYEQLATTFEQQQQQQHQQPDASASASLRQMDSDGMLRKRVLAALRAGARVYEVQFNVFAARGEPPEDYWYVWVSVRACVSVRVCVPACMLAKVHTCA
jgi:hypothetical protein